MIFVWPPSLIRVTIQTVMQTLNVSKQIVHQIFTIGSPSQSLNLNTKTTILLAIMKLLLSQLQIFAICVMPIARHALINMTIIVPHVPLTTLNGSKIVPDVAITVIRVIILQEGLWVSTSTRFQLYLIERV
jgi:hypothetical protein